MKGPWKARMDRMARANEESRGQHLRSLTQKGAVRIIEGLLSEPAAPPRKKTTHPVSLSRRVTKKRRRKKNG